MNLCICNLSMLLSNYNNCLSYFLKTSERLSAGKMSQKYCSDWLKPCHVENGCDSFSFTSSLEVYFFLFEYNNLNKNLPAFQQRHNQLSNNDNKSKLNEAEAWIKSSFN